MKQKPPSESDLGTPFPAEPIDLVVRAALCAVNCGAALEQGDRLSATDFLGDLRELIARIDRAGASDRADVKLLRQHEIRLSRRLFATSADELFPGPFGPHAAAPSHH